MISSETSSVESPAPRKLDLFIAVFDRAAFLHQILSTGLAMNVPAVNFVVFDDASTGAEEVPGLGLATVEAVCRSFDDPRVIYIRNETNIGFANSLRRYYDNCCAADYVGWLNPKDEFISGTALAGAIAKLDADPRLSFVVYPLRQVDRESDDRPVLFNYQRMSGRDFVATYVRDSTLQHCSSYAIVRASAARKMGIPRDLNLRKYGIEDGSGIDHDMLFKVATTGDVDFETEPPLRRRIIGGYTERFPLSFAYSQYLYARRLMRELEPTGFVTAETRQIYLSFWHLIIARGLVVSHRPVHMSELERGETRVRPHMRMPVLLYLPLECIRMRVWPLEETTKTYLLAAQLISAEAYARFTERLRNVAGKLFRRA